MTPEKWQRLNEVFHCALELAPEDTDGYLREACGEDPELLSEVRRMLEEHSRSGPLDRPLLPREPGDEPLFAAGDLLAERWRILRFISRGGMGEVYEAEDLLMHERRALKTLLPAIAADGRMIERFKQEIALSRRIPHSGVCRAFDLAVHARGDERVYFLTMEFLEGEPLSARLEREGSLEPAVGRSLMGQIGAALSAAHEAGIIHRDLKPSNIMLVPDGGRERAVITDFGLARGVAGPERTLTAPSQVMGTFDYMAPEQFTGSPASFASDQFALGRVAIRMMPGYAGWQRAISRATDPDPARRYPSVGDFVVALGGARTAAVTVRLPVLRRRHIAAVLGSIAVLAVGLLWWRKPPGELSAQAQAALSGGVGHLHETAYFAAVRSFERAVRLAPDYAPAQARLAEAWFDLGITERAKTAMLAARRDPVSGLRESERGLVEAMDRTVARDFAAAATVFERMAGGTPQLDLCRAWERASNEKAALDCYRRASAVAQGDGAIWLRLAILYSHGGTPEQSSAAFARAGQLFRDQNNLEGLIAAEYRRGVAAGRQEHFEEANQALQAALATARLAGNLEQQINATLQLANIAYAAGDASTAESLAKQGLETARENQMELHAISGLLNLGGAAQRKADYAAAVKQFQEALTLARREGTHRMAALANLNLASVYGQMREFGLAASAANEAMGFFRAENYTRETLLCLTLLGRSRRSLGDLDGALRSFEEAVGLAAKSGTRADVWDARANVGSLFASGGRFPEALAEYEKALSAADTPENKGYSGLQTGGMLTQLGRFEEARRRLDMAQAESAKFPALALRVARSRADLEQIQAHAANAKAIARRALAQVKPGDKAIEGELKRVLALASLEAGERAAALRYSQEALAAAEVTKDTAGIRSARLVLAEVRLGCGDRIGAKAVLEPFLTSFNEIESRWRALALLARLDPKYREGARQELNMLTAQWGASAKEYVKRPDIARLARPVLNPESANR